MKYQNNKDLAEAQYYLKMLDDFCKSGQVKIPEPTDTAMPWNLKEDPLKDYLIHLFTLKVTIAETGEEVQKFVRQVVNSKIKSKVFYDSVGKFIVECVHHMRFQRQRAWTESHRADDVLDWAPFKRMDEQVWLPLLDQLEQEHAEDGFDKTFFLKLMTGDGASKPENWERLVRDWKVCIEHQVLNKLKDFISLRQNNFETGLVRMMDQITLHRTLVSIRSLQFLNAHRTEDFIGCRESRHQILKALSPPECRLQLSGHHTLCHTRRSQQDDTLTCQSSQERERYLRLLLINAPVHLKKSLPTY